MGKIKTKYEHINDNDGENLFEYFGFGSTAVIRNNKLSPEAKGLYMYLSSFLGWERVKKGNFQVWPSRQRIVRELNISVNSFNKYLNELKGFGLVTVTQQRKKADNGQILFSNNIYTIEPYIPEHLIREEAPVRQFANVQGEITLADDLIEFWNSKGVTRHTKLGARTRARIERAFSQASKEYTQSEIFGAINNYSSAYHGGDYNYKYRLVEFLEKGVYLRFLGKATTWEKPRMSRKQDPSRFSFLVPDLKKEISENKKEC